MCSPVSMRKVWKLVGSRSRVWSMLMSPMIVIVAVGYLCCVVSKRFSKFWYERGEIVVWSSVDTYKNVCWCCVGGAGVYVYG